MQLLHDGAPAHRARATTVYLNANNVNVVGFPPKSPDLNIIEDILGWTKPPCKERRGYSNHTAKILYEWNNLSQNYVQRYVTSMRRRRLAVVNSVGGHACY